MRLRNLATFVKVAQLGSFHAAAQQLHTSQPAVSARISALEQELGAQLMQRDKSGTRLTARGTQLLPYAEKLLAISAEMKQQVGHGEPEQGTLRVGITDTLAQLWLTPLLRHWQARYPRIAFELTCDTTHTLLHRLQQHQIDVALVVSQPTLIPDICHIPLSQYPLLWVASPSLISQPTTLTVAQLATFPLLSFPRDTQPWLYLQQLFAQQPEPVLLHTCSAVASLLDLARQGIGIALLPAPLVSSDLQQGNLVQLQSSEPPPALAFCCGWREDDDRRLPQQLASSSAAIMQTRLD